MNKTKTSDAQKRASAKYVKLHRDRLALSAPKGCRAAWEAAAEAAGQSLNAWALAALNAAADQTKN